MSILSDFPITISILFVILGWFSQLSLVLSLRVSDYMSVLSFWLLINHFEGAFFSLRIIAESVAETRSPCMVCEVDA